MQDPRDGRWWLAGEDGVGADKPHEVIDKVIASVKPWFDERKQRHREYLKVYGISGDRYGQTTNRPQEERLEYQHAANVVDTVVTKVCKSRIVPMALTTGGTFSERRRAKLFNRFISGLFWEAGVFENDYRWSTDAMVLDCGVAKVCDRGGRVCVERVDPDCLFWDPAEAYLAGKVRTLYEESFVDRFRLIELLRDWGFDSEENVAHVRDVMYEAKDDPSYASPHNADLVRVREAWHLPSGKGAKDGKHAFTVKDRTIFIEDYDEEFFPHELLTSKMPLRGLTSPPLMAKLIGPQREYDQVTQKFRESHALMGVPRLLVRRGANINKAEVDDVPAAIIECDDPVNDIKEWNATPIHPDTYNYAASILQNMEKSAGVPETNLQGKPPEGISAAKALQLLDDLVAEKLTQFIRCRENFYCNIAEKCLALARRLASGGKYKVVAETHESRLIEEVDLESCNIPMGSYRLKVMPTSFLSQSPAARYEFLSEMRSRGDIDELEFRQLVDMPDLDAENDLETATVDIVDQSIEAILTRGLAFTAEAFDDHILIVQRGSKAYNLARIRAPEPSSKEYPEYRDRLRALKEYILSGMHWLKKKEDEAAANQQAQAAAAGAGAPPGGPMDMGPAGMVPGNPAVPPPGGPPPGAPPPVNLFAPAAQLSNGAP